MSVYVIDPTADSRWTDFIGGQPGASVFHSSGWLDALRRTYGYRPLVLTTSTPGARLTNGLPLCEIKGWGGKRLVSLPFSDHAEPLVDRLDDRIEMLSFLKHGVESASWKSVELRPRSDRLSAPNPTGAFPAVQRFCLHRLDLTATVEELHERLHPSCVQRPIRRAERERLEYLVGSFPTLVSSLYGLMRMTRRRHGLPPQPLAWFQNLVACLGERLTIRLATKDGRPIAGIMTLSFGSTMVYKYGCSDAMHHKSGAMPFLFWKAIQEAKQQGLDELDLGRSDLDQPGLIAFKDRLGATRSELTYYRQPGAAVESMPRRQARKAAGWLFERLPDPALSLAGRVLYKHFG